jgi:hypothetical protein
MIKKILFPETIFLCLYKRTFVLKKGLSYSRYIKNLGEKIFSPYTLLIERVPKTQKVHIEVELTDFMAIWPWGSPSAFGGVLFSKATIEFSGKRDFILQASIGISNLLMLFFYILLSSFFLLFIIFEAVARNMSLENVLILLLILAIILYPLIFTSLREIKFLNRIGFLGSDTREKYGDVN